MTARDESCSETAICPSNGMFDVSFHEAILALSALPHCTSCGCETKISLEDPVPYLLTLAATVVNKAVEGSLGRISSSYFGSRCLDGSSRGTSFSVSSFEMDSVCRLCP